MKELRGIIEDTLQEERNELERYDGEIHERHWRRTSERLEGWIEALEYVLHQMKNLEEEE